MPHVKRQFLSSLGTRRGFFVEASMTPAEWAEWIEDIEVLGEVGARAVEQALADQMWREWVCSE